MEKKLILEAQELRKQGLSYNQISKIMSITRSKANYLCKLDINECEEKYKQKQEFEECVCNLVKSNNSISSVCKALRHHPTNEYYKQIQRIIDKYSLDTSHFTNIRQNTSSNRSANKQSILEALDAGMKIPSSRIKERLIKEGLKEAKCECCGLSDWNGQPIPLQLHHINGNREDNRLENFQILCPNCHAQTDNYCRGQKEKKVNRCAICGKIISRNSTHCLACYSKLNHRRESKVIKQDKETILLDFKEFGSFDALSKKYKTSHITIRRWCSEYGLPTTSLAMRKYIRDLYGNIKWNFNGGNKESLIPHQNALFKTKCLLKEDGTIDKVYNSNKELKDDGFEVSSVLKVCRGERKQHQGKIFKYLDDIKETNK